MQNGKIKKIILLAGVFVAALVIRLIFVFQWYSKTPYGSLPLIDAKAYDDWALSILSGHFMRGQAFYQSPLYSYLLALVYKICGHAPIVISVIQAFAGAATCALLTEISLWCFGFFPALFAGILSVFYSPFLFFTAPLMKETLSIFLLTLSFFFLVREREVKSSRSIFAAGFFLGLAALLRGNVILITLALVALWLWRGGQPLLKKSILFVVAFLIPVLPCTLHNWLASRDFVLINYTAGFDFYLGNYQWATGTNSYPKDVSSEPLEEEMDTTRIAENVSGRALRPSEVSHFWFQGGLQYAFSHPLDETVLLLKKIWIFWNGYEQPDNYDQNFIAKYFPTVLSGPLFSFSLIACLAVFGFVGFWKQNPVCRLFAFFILVYMSSVVLFYVIDRYRLPVAVFLIPMGGAGFYKILDILGRKDTRALLKGSVLTLPVAALALSPPPTGQKNLESYDWGSLAALYSDLGKDSDAVKALDKSLSFSPQAANGEALIKGSLSCERMGDGAKAEEILMMAMKTYPSDPTTYYNFALFNYRKGNRDEALHWLDEASKAAPWHVEPLAAEALIYRQEGLPAKALEEAKKALQIDPQNPQMRALLSNLAPLDH